MRFADSLVVLLVLLLAALGWFAVPGRSEPATESNDRSPIDVVLTHDGKQLLTANQTSNSVSLLDRASGKVLAEVAVGKRPVSLAIGPQDDLVAVVGNWDGDLTLLTKDGDKLTPAGVIRLGAWEPHGVAITADGKTAYVALTTANQVAEIDLGSRQVTQRIDAGRWPRYLTLSPDGKRLAVGANGDGGVSVIDTAARKLDFQETFAGLNLGQMVVDRAGKYAYFPWMVYRHNPITRNNIQLGWVLASRIARVQLDKQARREAISLDPRGEAVCDPHGLSLSPDEETLVCAASGSQELLVYRMKGLPLIDRGGPSDHIDADLLKDKDRFYRIPLGGRPMNCVFTPEGKTVLVANYLLNAVQEVDLVARKVTRTLDLGGAKEPSLTRKGEAIFNDGKRSLDQWYSCHTCHYDGHTNAVTMDTLNDGRFGNFKTVLSLRGVTETAPYFWHGHVKDLDAALQQSFKDTMLGKPLTAEDLAAVKAYLETLTRRPNPNRTPEGALTPPARRGQAVFQGAKANCVQCHSGANFTDGKIHDVGTGERGDVYKGYNPPSLRGVYTKVQLLHDGRARSLEEVLKGPHAPGKVTGQGDLTPEELNDLLAYLRSL
jgi:YVTN family beta-propeller protein